MLTLFTPADAAAGRPASDSFRSQPTAKNQPTDSHKLWSRVFSFVEQCQWLLQPVLVGEAIDGLRRSTKIPLAIWIGTTALGLIVATWRRVHDSENSEKISAWWSLIGVPFLLGWFDFALTLMALMALIPTLLVRAAQHQGRQQNMRIGAMERSTTISLCLIELFSLALVILSVAHCWIHHVTQPGQMLAIGWLLAIFRANLRHIVKD